MNMQPSFTPTSAPGGTFSDRIKLLIQRVGSATEIARMCGFSEGVVRSWRDGNTDPSRAIQNDPSTSTPDDQYSSEVVSPQRPKLRLGTASVSMLPAHDNGVDSQRLNTAMKILQSELELADSRLTLADNTDMLADLYEILGPGGINVDTTAMVTFNHRLAKRIREGRSSPVA
jgi:hypothetical protein